MPIDSPVTKVKLRGRQGTWKLHELLYEAIEKHLDRISIVPLDAIPHEVHLPRRSGTNLSKKEPAKLEVVIPEELARALRGSDGNGTGGKPMILFVELPPRILLELTSPIILPGSG